MENKINIAELLKDCPRGMELDCVLCENVTFGCIVDGNCFPIQIQTPEGDMLLGKYGCTSLSTHAKCVIFPKGKTTWEGFVPPCKFKDGDILINKRGSIFIYKGPMCYNKQLADFYCGYRIADGAFLPKLSKDTHFGDIPECRLATGEEKQKLFKVIKDNGYKWVAKTKTLEKLIEPKFKVGDNIRIKGTSAIYVVTEIKEDCYMLDDKDTSLLFKTQDQWELVPNKFDITTLKPFDKVLARDTDNSMWTATLFSHLRGRTFYTVGGWYNQCIPFEGNEHLLGECDDCDDFYKTWE